MSDLVSALCDTLGDILTGKALREKIAEENGVNINETVITTLNGGVAYSALTGNVASSVAASTLGWALVVSTCAELAKSTNEFYEIMQKPGANNALMKVLGLK